MTDSEHQATNHKQPASKASKAATAAADPAEETATTVVDTAADTAAAAADVTAADPTADDAAADEAAADATRSAKDSLSQAAGAAAQRAGVAAQRATEVLTDVAGDVASTVQTHAPAVIDASRNTAGIAAREVQSASSENLMLGTVFSSGVAFGLMLARAPRVLVLLALVPVVTFGANLIGRRNGRGPWASAKPAPKTTSGAKGKTSVS